MHRFESCQNTLPEVENCMQNKPKQLKQRIGGKKNICQMTGAKVHMRKNPTKHRNLKIKTRVFFFPLILNPRSDAFTNTCWRPPK